MKHLEPKFPDFKYLVLEISATERRTGDDMIAMSVYSDVGIHLAYAHCLAEPCSRPSVWRQLNLGPSRLWKVVALDR
jgi:hypothetical protein